LYSFLKARWFLFLSVLLVLLFWFLLQRILNIRNHINISPQLILKSFCKSNFFPFIPYTARHLLNLFSRARYPQSYLQEILSPTRPSTNIFLSCNIFSTLLPLQSSSALSYSFFCFVLFLLLLFLLLFFVLLFLFFFLLFLLLFSAISSSFFCYFLLKFLLYYFSFLFFFFLLHLHLYHLIPILHFYTLLSTATIPPALRQEFIYQSLVLTSNKQYTTDPRSR
jgi:hypothetical protein